MLRPGNTVYMPPGTVHLVFRQPQGVQTLGMAGHVLRRSADLDLWLEVLYEECERVGDKAFGEDHRFVVPPIMKTVKSLLSKRLVAEGDIERLGGQEKIDMAKKIATKISRLCEKRMAKVREEDGGSDEGEEIRPKRGKGGKK